MRVESFVCIVWFGKLAQRREQEVRQLRGGGGGGGRGNSGQRNGDRGDYNQWQDTPEIRVTFTVSNVKCGLIIGRGE